MRRDSNSKVVFGIFSSSGSMSGRKSLDFYLSYTRHVQRDQWKGTQSERWNYFFDFLESDGDFLPDL